MSQKKSIRIPDDLMEAVKTYHAIREKVTADADAFNAEWAIMQERLQRERTRLTMILGSATDTMHKALVEAKLVVEGEPCAIDTSYLDQHGMAFVTFEGNGDMATVKRILH